jgi:ribosomal protein S28E/S33
VANNKQKRRLGGAAHMVQVVRQVGRGRPSSSHFKILPGRGSGRVVERSVQVPGSERVQVVEKVELQIFQEEANTEARQSTGSNSTVG